MISLFSSVGLGQNVTFEQKIVITFFCKNSTRMFEEMSMKWKKEKTFLMSLTNWSDEGQSDG